jgi:hypothetical protein
MISFPSKLLTVLLISSFIAGCKLAVVVTQGGDVQSTSTLRDCAGGSVCEFEITDSTFSDSFTAVPKEGYQFVKWRAGGSDFFCANSANPTCSLSNVGTAGNAGIEAVIASFQMFHIMPVFEFVDIDTDSDGIKNHLDDDDDGDGVLDVNDPCPLDPNPACGLVVTIEQLIANTCWTVSADIGNAVAQSFTPAVSGHITELGLAVEAATLNNNLVISEGGINGEVIHVQSIVTPSITVAPIPLAPFVLTVPVAVTAGQQYTMAVEDSGGFGMRFCGSGANPYSDGQAYQVRYFESVAHPTDDAAFSITIE